jgi:hypothetical protein
LHPTSVSLARSCDSGSELPLPHAAGLIGTHFLFSARKHLCLRDALLLAPLDHLARVRLKL